MSQRRTILPKLEFRPLLRGERGEGVSCCYKVLGTGILCSYSPPCRSDHSVPVNSQQDKCYFLFCNFFTWVVMKGIILLKVKPERQRALRVAIMYISGYRHILLQRHRARMTKHRQQRRRVRAKGTDLTWSQVCLLLHQLFSPRTSTAMTTHGGSS